MATTVDLRADGRREAPVGTVARGETIWPEQLAKAFSSGIIHRNSDGSLILPLLVDQFRAMVEAGIFPENASIELIDGLMLHKDRRDAEGDIMTEGERHYLAKQLLRQTLDRLVSPHGFHAVTEPPIILSDFTLPEPDVAVLRGRLLDYRGRLPVANDALLVAEVSWSSLRYDQRVKLERYAAAGIPNYWIVNLAAQTIEVRTQPDSQNAQFARLETFDRTGTIPLTLSKESTIRTPVVDFLLD